MMSEEFLKKRISETKTEVFPLDRILPMESIYLIFEQEYNKLEDKNIFFKDRKFQRLREGYFAMFVAVSLQDISVLGKSHYLVFPSNPDNDVYIAYRMNDNEEIPKFKAYEFDIKEYTNWSPNFEAFAHMSIIPKIDIYNIAIPTYRKVNGRDIKPLIVYLKSKNLTTKIWFLGLPDETDYNYNISIVTIINKDGIVYEKIINLNDWVDRYKTPMVFQDIIRFK